jgi:ADP-ribose pyrophosphatase YjhB (NUDIX family)
MPGLHHIDASGALVIVYHMDGAEPELLMGEESKFVSDDKSHVAKYARDFGKSLFDAFTYKGDIGTPADVEQAHAYFARTAAALEAANRIGHVTYADFKKSSKPGLISAKPRFVPWENNGKLGFTKGGYIAADGTVEHTGAREVFEETGITIDPTKLINTHQLISADRVGTTRYAIYLYKLSEKEYQSIVDDKILEKKNASRFNELHNIRFARRPAQFANSLSEQAYARIVGRLVGGVRSSPKAVKQAKTMKAAKSVKRSPPRTRRSPPRPHKTKAIDAASLYTEKQQDLLCGQHALNHLLQEQKFVSLPGRARKHRLINGQVDLQAFCRHIRSEARKDLGDAANETIDCPPEGDYQADVLVRAIKDELRYSVDELPFHQEGIAELRKRLPSSRPRLIGLLVNIAGYHWTAVMSRIQPKQHVYIDSLSIPKSFNPLSDGDLVDFLSERNPYRIYILSLPEKGAYYRCRQC